MYQVATLNKAPITAAPREAIRAGAAKLENDLMYQVETLNKAPITQAAARDAIRAGAAKLEDAFETTEGRGSIFPGKYIVSSL